MTTNPFLPVDYEQPKNGGHYMKLAKGENKLRILSPPILGWLDWKDKKPLRYRMSEKPESSVDPSKPVKHFWALVVWNYATNNVEVLEITQSTIQSAIGNLSKDADWGSPFGYDIKITKTGDGMDTEYATNPVPHKAVPKEAIESLVANPVNLEALFNGGDPFSTSQKSEPKEDGEILSLKIREQIENFTSQPELIEWAKNQNGLNQNPEFRELVSNKMKTILPF